MNYNNELTPQDGVNNILSIIDTFSDSSKNVNMKILELILKLESKINSDAFAIDDLLQRIEELEKENIEWMNAFNRISDALSEMVQVNVDTHGDLFAKADELFELIDTPIQTVESIQSDESVHDDGEIEVNHEDSEVVEGSSDSEVVEESSDFDDVDNNTLISR